MAATAYNASYGRNSRGGGPVKRGQNGPAAGNDQAVYPLAQTLPSVAPAQPRFRPPEVSPVPQPRTNPGQSGAGPWRGGDGANDRLIFRDRHAFFQRGSARGGTTWEPGNGNVLNAGPVRPDMRLINETWNWQVGTGSAYTDDLSREYTWVGEQGSGWTSINGGTPGFYRQGPGGTPVGDPNEGPGRVWGGPPHGLHTTYPASGAQAAAGFRARPQMVPARVDRLSNSRIAGQTYSQWTQHQGGGR